VFAAAGLVVSARLVAASLTAAIGDASRLADVSIGMAGRAAGIGGGSAGFASRGARPNSGSRWLAVDDRLSLALSLAG
ncbi:hypothetical protein ABTN84_18920, partial [Acinetobacter baumannii]